MLFGIFVLLAAPINQSATITRNPSSDPDNGLWKELEMGRFEFRGLAAGDYVVRVQLAFSILRVVHAARELDRLFDTEE